MQLWLGHRGFSKNYATLYCGCFKVPIKHSAIKDIKKDLFRIIYTFSKFKRSPPGDNRDIPNHELEVMKKDGMIMKTFLYLLRAFVALSKLILFAGLNRQQHNLKNYSQNCFSG